jgi:hypothetical protein
VADTSKGRTYPAADTDDAVHELHTPAADTIDGALGPNFDAWTKHVQAHVQLPDADGDGDDEEEAKGDSMYAAAVKQNERTNRLRAAEQDTADEATAAGRSTTATSNRAAAERKLAQDNAKH